MADYGIKIELLSDFDKSVLLDLDVDVQRSGVVFQRKLNEANMRTVWRILTALKYRTNDEENHINFALGDWMQQAEDWYGKDELKKWFAWMSSDWSLPAHRSYLYQMIGITLIYLQRLETLIKECCSLLSSKAVDKVFEINDILSADPKLRKKTLGQLVSVVQDMEIFDSTFEDKLSSFVELRNRFVHRLWEEEILGAEFDHPLLTKLEKLTSGLLEEIEYMLKVFEGFRFAIYKPLAQAVKQELPHMEIEILRSSWFHEQEKKFWSLVKSKLQSK